MEGFRLEESALGQRVTVTVLPCGADWQVLVLGGGVPHVGSVSVAAPGRAAESRRLPGHRDDVVGERFARRLADASGQVVAVTCGIHYDGLSPQGLEAVTACCDGLLERTLARLRGS